MIGKAYVSIFKYYDTDQQKMAFKKRPVLIVGKSDSKDYVVLPISRVTNRQYLDPEYDIIMRKEDFPLMNLKSTSYIRTHKQSVIHEGDLTRCIVDVKSEYSDIYKTVIEKMKDFQDILIKNAL
ncbi:MAG: hypothetical protein HFG63_03410 [Lachnospiraceae bacterium]|nr:hypothetical protein [Lachnospiraceae bacterium]